MSERQLARCARAEALAEAGAFVVRQVRDGPYGTLPPEGLVALLLEAETDHSLALGGAAAELARRVARMHGLPEPPLPPGAFGKLGAMSDRAICVFAMRRAADFHCGAAPQVSRAAYALEMGAARLLSADPEIRAASVDATPGSGFHADQGQDPPMDTPL